MLEGYKVVEMATYIAGPGAAGMMADWGAEVIKVEAPGGDPIRWNRPPGREGGSSPNFELDNRGKRSIAVDYRRPEGCEVIRRLAAWADVFITSARPKALARAGLDYPTLAAVNPGIVYASVTGYGPRGALADISAFDVTAFWSRSGLAGQMTPLDGSPPIGRPGMGDHTTAISTALGVMTALLVRTRTGRGQLVESSLLRSGAYLIGFDLAEQLRRGETVGAQRRGSQGVLNSHFATAGGRWFFVWIGDPDRDWPLLCRLAGRADMAEDPRLSTVEARAAAAGDIMHALETGFARLTLEAVGAELDRNGLMWSPVQRASDAVEDPACADAGCFVEVDDGDGGAFRAPAAPVGFPGAESARKGAVPAPGQHTDAVLAQMGYSEADVAMLRRVQAVA